MSSSSLTPRAASRVCLPHHRVVRAAAIVAAQCRDDAEAALVVAALGHLDVGVVAWGGQEPRRVSVVEIGGKGFRLPASGSRHGDGFPVRTKEPCTRLGDGADDLGDLSRAEDGVDFRNLFQQLGAVALRHAAGDDQLPARPRLLVFGHLQDGVDRLLLGLVDERAGVDHQYLGGFGVLGQLVPGLLGEPEHHLGVNEVLGAAQRHHADLHHRRAYHAGAQRAGRLQEVRITESHVHRRSP